MREGVAIGGCNSVAEWQLPKLYMAVRFRSPALKIQRTKSKDFRFLWYI